MIVFILFAMSIFFFIQQRLITRVKKTSNDIYDLKKSYLKELMRFTRVQYCDKLPESFISHIFDYSWAKDPLTLVVYLYLVGKYFEAEFVIKYNSIKEIEILLSLDEIAKDINVIKPFVAESLMNLVRNRVIDIRPSGRDNNELYFSLLSISELKKDSYE